MQALRIGNCHHPHKIQKAGSGASTTNSHVFSQNYTDFSTAKIGALIGHKDHATVLHACKTIKELKEVDKSFRAEIDEIQAALKKDKNKDKGLNAAKYALA